MEEPAVFYLQGRRNIGNAISNYVALYPRRQESSVTVKRTLNLTITVFVCVCVLLNSVMLTSGYAALNGLR
jgi:hypothetical protein